MATFSISGDNASYTLTLSEMSTSTRYHGFVADINPDGTANGFYCRRSAIGSSTTWAYNGASASPFSQYQRLVQVYTTENATSFNAGTKYTSTEIFNILSAAGSWSSIFSDYIPAHSVSSTLTCYFDNTLQSVTFTNGETATNRQGVGYVDYSSAVKISSTTLRAGYSTWNGTLYWENEYGNSYEFGYVVNGVVYIQGQSVQEEISFTGNRSITIYGVGSFSYLYNVHAFGNGGVTSGGDTSVFYPTSGYASDADDTSYDFPLSRVNNQFTKSGYVIDGWAFGSTPVTGETVYTDTIPIVASQSGTTNYIHAVWREQISLFYWFGNETTDASNIQRGKTRTMTATMWDNFADTVDTLASICGVSVSISRPSSGSRMNASQYNTAVTALTTIKNSRTAFGNVTLPSAVSSGNSITAAQFQGTGSIKGALNAMIALL